MEEAPDSGGALVKLWDLCLRRIFFLLSSSQILHFTQGWGVLVGKTSADAKS